MVDAGGGGDLIAFSRNIPNNNNNNNNNNNYNNNNNNPCSFFCCPKIHVSLPWPNMCDPFRAGWCCFSLLMNTYNGRRMLLIFNHFPQTCDGVQDCPKLEELSAKLALLGASGDEACCSNELGRANTCDSYKELFNSATVICP